MFFLHIFSLPHSLSHSRALFFFLLKKKSFFVCDTSTSMVSFPYHSSFLTLPLSFFIAITNKTNDARATRKMYSRILYKQRKNT